MTPGLRREPAPDLDAVGEDQDLAGRIRAEIRRDGPITFARYMELALYDPTGGYYRADVARPGRSGDFVTAPELHPIFGGCLARLVADAWARLGRPDRFVLRELGAGTGMLAVAILDRLASEAPEARARLRYDPIEIEPRRIEALETRLRGAGHGDALLDAAERGGPITGVILGNEVLDALPTHRVVVRNGALCEILVGLDGDRFVDVEDAPTTPALDERLSAEGIELVEGQRAEVCLALDAWLPDVAAGLDRGLLVLIDYGHPARELYDPARRRDGTLMAYLRQRAQDDPYRHVGRQDLTAHVDVTAVERAAVAAGLAHLGTATQAALLIGLGVDELLREVQADPSTTFEDYLVVRSSIMRLLDPAAMGRFQVVAFGRGWPGGPPRGFGRGWPDGSQRVGPAPR